MKYISVISLILIFLVIPISTNLNGAQKWVRPKGQDINPYALNDSHSKIPISQVKSRGNGRFWKSEDPRALLKQAKKLAIASLIFIPLSLFGFLLVMPILSLISLKRIKKAKKILEENPVEDQQELMKKAANYKTLAILGLIAFAGIGIGVLIALYQLLY